jgi:sugar/nucleoside kinase (ribokinase family)
MRLPFTFYAMITNVFMEGNRDLMEEGICAVVAGHICLDIIPDIKALRAGGFNETFLPGHLLEVGPAALSTGGVVSNTGLALHRLGIPTKLIGKIGADAFGRIVRELIEAEGPSLAAGLVNDPQVATSYSIIINPPDVDRIVLHNPAANHTFCADDIDYDLVRRAAVFHFGYPPAMRAMYVHKGQGLADLFRHVKQTGATSSLDMCYPDPAAEAGQVDWAAILKATLPWVDIFLPSIEELLVLLHPGEFKQFTAGAGFMDQVTPSLLHSLSDELLAMGVPLVVIKLGVRGLYLRTAGQQAFTRFGRAAPANLVAWYGKELWVPTFRVAVIGTTGAGDAAIAGFLSALLRGLGPEMALTMASAVGACNVEAADALSGLRGWEATLERIQSGWERLPLHLQDPAWSWNQPDQVWCRNG